MKAHFHTVNLEALKVVFPPRFSPPEAVDCENAFYPKKVIRITLVKSFVVKSVPYYKMQTHKVFNVILRFSVLYLFPTKYLT